MQRKPLLHRKGAPVAHSTRNLLRRNTIGFWHLVGLTIITLGIYPFWLNFRLLQNQKEVMEEMRGTLVKMQESLGRMEQRPNTS